MPRRRGPVEGDPMVSMSAWKLGIVGAVVVVLGLAGIAASPAEGADRHPATGVGSCTLKGWNPGVDPDDAKDLPEGDRPQSYRPDDYDCTGATFATPGVEFARFPQPGDFQVANRQTVLPSRVCRAGTCTKQLTPVTQPVRTANALAPYFPPFT